MGLPNFSVHKPVTIAMVFLAIILIGLIGLTKLPVELMPNVSYKKITITTKVRGGMPPLEVETLVTRPIEEAVSTASKVSEIYSRSEKEESTVTIVFEPGTNMDFAALEVREKFAKIKNKLPKEIERPVIARYEQTDAYVMIISMTSEIITPEAMRKIADEKIKEQLMRISGVANVDVYGGRERKILVEIDQNKIRNYNIPINKIIDNLGINNINLLAGNIERKRNTYLIRTLGEFRTIDGIKNTPIAMTQEGSLIRLGDVAVVMDSYMEPSAFARLGLRKEDFARPVVSLYIHKESTANTVMVANNIKKQIEKIKTTMNKNIKIDITLNRAEFILKAINTVREALITGAVLSAIILYLFLLNIGSTIIILTAIPISIIATFGMMYFQGLTLNVMTLSGLALGIGMLVDNSIVVLENIAKHRERGKSVKEATIVGTEEMWLAICSSTLTHIVVFFPIVFVSEEIKMLYGVLAFTVAYSLLASLLVAITLVPMLASNVISEKPTKFDIKILNKFPKIREIASLSFIRDRYIKFISLALRHRYRFILSVFILFIFSIFLFMRLDREPFGSTEEGQFTIFAKLDAGAKLGKSDEITKEIEKYLLTIPEIQDFTSRVEGWSSTIYVSLVPFSQRGARVDDIINRIRPKMKEIEHKYRGGFVYFSEAEEVGKKEIKIDAYGYNYDTLGQLISQLGQSMAMVPGLVDMKRSIEQGRPEYQIIVDKEKAAFYGLTVKDVADVLHAQTRGLRAMLFHTESSEVETVARLQAKDRSTFEDIKNLSIPTPDGKMILLSQIATFKPALGPSEIHRKNKNRYIELSATSTKLSLTKVINRLKILLKDVKFPRDYYWELGEEYQRQLENQKQLLLAMLLTVVLLYMVLAAFFESFWQPVIIMFAIPLAYIGTILLLFVTKTPVGIGVIIGAIMLGGIVVNNSIMLIDRINVLKSRGFSDNKALLTAGRDRLRPIIMTVSTTVLGLLPMAIIKTEASGLWAPLAIAVIGGLIFSTVLTLFMVPSIYLVFEDAKKYFNSSIFKEKVYNIISILRLRLSENKHSIMNIIKRKEGR